MVDLAFRARAAHLVPLALMKRIASVPAADPPEDVRYIGADGVKAVKGALAAARWRIAHCALAGMALVNRGRLSVQRVGEEAWAVVELLAERGGWEEGDSGGKRAAAAAKTKRGADGGDATKKRKAEEEDGLARRRSTRARRQL